jgi:hypothetical protein
MELVKQIGERTSYVMILILLTVANFASPLLPVHSQTRLPAALDDYSQMRSYQEEYVEQATFDEVG